MFTILIHDNPAVQLVISIKFVGSSALERAHWIRPGKVFLYSTGSRVTRFGVQTFAEVNIIKPFLKSSVEVRSVLILIHDDPEGEGSDRADHFSSASSLPAGHSPTTEPRKISWLPQSHAPHIYILTMTLTEVRITWSPR